MRNPVILAALLMAAGQAQAENLNAHEHGVMNLMLAQDGHEVTVELEAAADSFLGFEYQPVTEQEQQALADLVQLLNQPQRLISLAAGCRLTDVDQELPFAPAHKHEHKSEHDHESEHEHESEHNHESEHHHDEHEEKLITIQGTTMTKSMTMMLSIIMTTITTINQNTTTVISMIIKRISIHLIQISGSVISLIVRGKRFLLHS